MYVIQTCFIFRWTIFDFTLFATSPWN